MDAQDEVIKTISFTIPKQEEILINYYVNDGYDRKYVIFLFKKLQSLGFGKFIIGKKGRGHVTKFIPTLECPDAYIIEITLKKRGRKPTK